MKTYLLRKPKAVEPQKVSGRSPRKPVPSVPKDAAREAPAPTARGPVLYIGLDVHTDSIAVSLAPSESAEVRRYGVIGGTHDDVLKLVKKLQAAHPGHELRLCYEAGPHGYPLGRCLQCHRYDCILVAPSKVPRQPGDRVKTNRRDADQLARLLRAGELTAIYVPDPQDEAIRDLLRARYQVLKQQHRARQQLKMFLLRHNLHYAGTKAWTAAHRRYLATVKLPFAEQQWAFQEMVNVISEATERLERYDAQLPRVVPGWRWQPVVKALMSLRGVALWTAATLVAELGDLTRFATAGQLMSYLGLVPSEDSTGDKRRQGGPHQDGQRPRPAGLDRGGVELSDAGADQPGFVETPERGEQRSQRHRLGGAEPAPSPLPTSDHRAAQEIAGGSSGPGPGVERVGVGHRATGQTMRAQNRCGETVKDPDRF